MTQLINATNANSTLVREYFTANATVLQVASTAGFAVSGILAIGNYIDREIITYTDLTPNSFLGLMRGQYGTHARTAIMTDVVVANNELGTAATANTGNSAGQIPTVPVPMSSISNPVKTTIDGITNTPNSAAFSSSTDFATAAQGVKADSALQAVTKASVGLGNVDNTADSAKPVSGPQQTALNLKANTAAISAVGLSGAYSDLSSKPTLGTASTQATEFFATAAQGLLAETALQSVDLSDYATIEDVAVVTAYVDTEIGLLSDEIDTELELKANVSDMRSQFDALQESYDTLNNNFLCLLKWSIITFGQVPEGLESYIEPALNTE